MKLNPESTLALSDLIGAFVYKEKENGTEETYRIHDFYFELEPTFDNPDDQDEYTGIEFTKVWVTLTPTDKYGRLEKDKKTGMALQNLNDYTIQISRGFNNDKN
jgi:hypothetical protein